jgi:antitoxin HicB
VNRRYIVVVSPTEFEDETGFTVTVPALPGLVTEGDSVDECLANSREAVVLFLESMRDRGLAIPLSDEQLDGPTSDDLVTSVEVRIPEAALSR